MISLGVEEVQAVLHFFDVYSVFVSRVLKDELFEIQKGSPESLLVIFLCPWT